VSFEVRYSGHARDDLIRLYNILLDRAPSVDELDVAEQALAAIRAGFETLRAPLSSTARPVAIRSCVSC
jgi:hypothetical protein